MSERRRARRSQVFRSAKVAFNGSHRDCVVRDISTLGVRLAFVSIAFIPDTFALTFDATRSSRACRVVWRSGTEIGVEFQGASFRSAA